MTPSGKTICLCMIVKNEAHVIARCLASARPLIDHWLIVDTGSTDGTQDIIRDTFADIPGALVERSWVDFAYNRSEALTLARRQADYSLIIDADDEFVVPPGFAMPELDADSYVIDIIYSAVTYQRTQVVSNAIDWRYRGVLHEFLEGENARSVGHLPIGMRIHHEGQRSQDPATYRKDADILERALATETDPFLVSRYTFYLAQSFYDAGMREQALKFYLRRTKLGFWDQEVYISFHRAGLLLESLQREADVVIATFQKATDTVPSRAEAAHAASRFCRRKSRFAQGRDIAARSLGMTAPADGLFVEPWIYDYGLYDEHAINAYWADDPYACLDSSLRGLQSGTVPASEQPRFLANMRFALDKLAGRTG